jgi:REP element-mobilizing transposase RayT
MSRPQRLDGFDYLGPRQYFLTFCTRRRLPVFRDADMARLVLAQLHRTGSRHSFLYLAYCLMPDHAHALVEGLTTQASLPLFVKSAKESSGRAYFRRTGRPLWQEGYYEHVLRGEEDARGIARYIVENPLRAGLVDDAVLYPFAGSDRWSLRELVDSC